MKFAAKSARAWLAVVFGLALWALGSGCRVVQTAADLPGSAVRVVLPGHQKSEAIDLLALQQTLMRFSDEYSAQLAAAVDDLRREGGPLDRLETQRMKYAAYSEMWTIAASPNALAGLLDMVAVTTLVRMTAEDYWLPKVYGESARPFCQIARIAETNIWKVAATALTPAQQDELRQAIETWHRQRPDPKAVLSTRAVGLASDILRAQAGGKETPAASSVFGIIGLDPLAGLDPATQELAQTRMFGERALFVMQRMPVLLRLQTEIFTLGAAALPETQGLLTNSIRLAGAMEQFGQVAQELPDRLSRERAEILKSLTAQESELRALATDTRLTLEAGSQMASNLDTALKSFDAVVQRLGSGPPKTNSEPFRIQDYTEAAAQIDATAQRLTEVLQRFDQTLGSTNLAAASAQATVAVQAAEAGGRALVEYAFWKSLLLLACACVLFLATAVLRRWLVMKFGLKQPNHPARSERTTAPPPSQP